MEHKSIDKRTHRFCIDTLFVSEVRTASPSIISPDSKGVVSEKTSQGESLALAEISGWTMFLTLYR
jgi:hypothetical protein